VRDYACIFAEDWCFATQEKLDVPSTNVESVGRSVVCPLPSGPDQSHNASAFAYFAGIMSARERCYITTPYFTPDEPTLRALLTAAKSGVDVRILLPAKNDLRIVGAAARSFYRQLVFGGVRIFEYQPSMLHAKTMVVDERFSLVGSANVDMRSFRLNFEIGAILFDREFSVSLSQRFLGELANSREVTTESLNKVGVSRRLVQGMSRLLSPLL
jgi:cardiolipin synthase